MTRRVLLCANRLAGWSGSELIVIELVEYLRDRGWNVTIFANHLADPVRALLADYGTAMTEDGNDIDLSEFDVIYVQHGMASLLLSDNLDRLASRKDRFPVFIFAHLSPFEPLAAPAPSTELPLADVILANSRETAAALEGFDPGYAVARIYPNPAPPAFFKQRTTAPRPALRSLLVVSNHLPDEVREAMDVLRPLGVSVTHVGAFGEVRRLAVDDILSHDAVLSIGKTVQYALASRTPVFCYDHFGGPGWLTGDNFDLAARQNFSGRSHPQRYTGDELAALVRTGFSDAQRFVLDLPDDAFDDWRLECHIEPILSGAETILKDPDRIAARQDLVTSRTFRGHALLENRHIRARLREYLGRLAAEQTIRHLKRDIEALQRASQQASLNFEQTGEQRPPLGQGRWKQRVRRKTRGIRDWISKAIRPDEPHR